MLRSARLRPLLVGSLLAVVLHAAAWSQCPGWSNAWPGLTGNNSPRDIVEFDDGMGLTRWMAYGGESFDNLEWGGVKRWNGATWQNIGPDYNGQTSLLVWDEGSGPRLFAAGGYGVMRLDGGTWTSIGATMMDVQELIALDTGSGPELYIAGTDHGTQPSCIRKRSSTGEWLPFSEGLFSSRAYDLVAFDAGSGPELYACGRFHVNLGEGGVVKRDLNGWSLLPNPPIGPYAALTRAIVLHDDGTGTALYGAFLTTPSYKSVICRWDGAVWTVLPGLFEGGTEAFAPNVFSLASHDADASGTKELYVGGRFTSISGIPMNRLARWDGSTWSELGTGLSVFANLFGVWMLKPDPASGVQLPRLFVGGGFEQAGGVPAYHVASWDGCSLVSAECFGDGSAATCPCGNHGSMGSGCANSFGTGGRLVASGTPSVAVDGLALLANGMPNSAALYFQGTSAIGAGTGTAFGDGLRCAAGTVVRLGVQTNSGGSSSFPAPGDPPISQRGAVPPAGGARHYQVWYRNAATYCTPDTFNLTNGVQVQWIP